MKIKFIAVFAVAAAAVISTGCVRTVTGQKTAALPFLKDRVEGRYERPASQVFEAARQVLNEEGVMLNETTLHGATDGVRGLEGKVNQRHVWIRVEEIDPKVTSVVVQARTRAGGRDLELVHQIEKEIALKLVR